MMCHSMCNAKRCFVQLVLFDYNAKNNKKNGINDFLNNQKNDYNQIGLVVKNMFWHYGGSKILDY